MRELNSFECQQISGAGITTGILSFPLAVAAGITVTGLSLMISPIVVAKEYRNQNSIPSAMNSLADYLQVGPKMGWAILQFGYHLPELVQESAI